MNTQRNSGFTLVELMVGMVSAAVLAVVFSAVVIYGYKGWNELQGQADMQADADVVMRTMDQIVRAASNVTWSGSTLTVGLTNATTQTFTKTGSNFVWVASGTTSILITNRVASFVCGVTNFGDKATVSVALKLASGYETLDMPFSIFLRN